MDGCVEAGSGNVGIFHQNRTDIIPDITPTEEGRIELLPMDGMPHGGKRDEDDAEFHFFVVE